MPTEPPPRPSLPDWEPSRLPDDADDQNPPAAAPSTDLFGSLSEDMQVEVIRALVARAAHRLRDEGIGDGSYAPIWRAAYRAYQTATGHAVLDATGARALEAIRSAGRLVEFARILTREFGMVDA